MSLFPRMSAFAPVRHDFATFFSIFNEVQRLSETISFNRFSPKFDVKEDRDAYKLEGKLPGIEQKDVTLEFRDDQTLTIKGRTEWRKEEGQRPSALAEKDRAASTSDAKASESKEVATTGSGSKEVVPPAPQHTYWVSERSVGEFARSFSFPERVDQQNVKASLKNGILRVVVPKMAVQSGGRKDYS